MAVTAGSCSAPAAGSGAARCSTLGCAPVSRELPDPLAPPEGYGQQPGQGIQRDAVRRDAHGTQLGDTSCDVQPEVLPGLPGGRCGRRGVRRVYFGCINEHVGYSDMCATHEQGALARFPMACRRCNEAGEPGVVKVIRTEALPG